MPLIEYSLNAYGVSTVHNFKTTTGIQLCYQNQTIVYGSCHSLAEGAKFAKINLKATEWKSTSDISNFINEQSPIFLSGDPQDTCPKCQHPRRNAEGKADFYLYVQSLKHLLQEKLKQKAFVESTKDYMNNPHNHSSELTRILVQYPQLNTPLTILLGICVDGITFHKAPLAKKSNKQFWPLMGKWICDSSKNLNDWPVLALWPHGNL